jgi:hypothetical protein
VPAKIELLRREDIVSSAVESGVSHGLHVNQTWFVDWTTVEYGAGLQVRERLLPCCCSSLFYNVLQHKGNILVTH